MIRLFIRQCSIAALRNGGTIAGGRVFDSDNSPLLDVLSETNQTSPYVTVYTDDDTHTSVQGMDLAAADRTLLLVIEIGIGSKTVLATPEGEEPPPPILQIAHSDEGMELVLDVLEWQVKKALWQDPANKWGDMLRRMAMSIRRVTSIRGAQAGQGGRYAMRQIAYHVGNVVSDPIPGQMIHEAGAIAEFIVEAKSDLDAGISTAITFAEQFLAATNAPEWRQIQAALGLTTEGIRASGAGPLELTDPDTAGALLEEPPDEFHDQGGIELEE